MMQKKPFAYAVVVPLAFHAQLSSSQERPLEEVLVTGSYIRGSAIDAPSPVQVIDRSAIDAQGASTVWDVVKNLEVNQGSTTNENPSEENGTISGTSNVNLRNLGQNSTLTLLNGKRQVSAAALTQDGSEFVDLNAIPQVMIERLEVLTDGGSALYGSDAIAGVVNLILRTRFDGLELNVRHQRLDSGDHPGESTASALWGTSFNDDKTHLVLGGE
jgi:iron complex outermembrane receptor protein